LPRADDDTSAGAPKKRARFSPRAIGVLALVAVVIYAIDRVAKYLVVANLSLGEQVPVLGQLLQLHYVKNPGAAFSIGSGSTWIFAIIATAVVVFIILFARRIRSVGWAVLFGLLLGGNAGNLTDRLTGEEGFGVGHVVDFFQIYGFNAIFNVADMAIVFSMVIFVVLTVRGVRLDGTRQPKTTKPTDAAAEPASDAAPVDGAPADTETRP
jgi:signal peptidase II